MSAPAKKKKEDHPIWSFFAVDEDDQKYGICMKCAQRISRGIGKGVSNTPMINHLKAKHAGEYAKFSKLKGS